jgi:hypothetical protein
VASAAHFLFIEEEHSLALQYGMLIEVLGVEKFGKREKSYRR